VKFCKNPFGIFGDNTCKNTCKPKEVRPNIQRIHFEHRKYEILIVIIIIIIIIMSYEAHTRGSAFSSCHMATRHSTREYQINLFSLRFLFLQYFALFGTAMSLFPLFISFVSMILCFSNPASCLTFHLLSDSCLISFLYILFDFYYFFILTFSHPPPVCYGCRSLTA
jgi:hypothetical protein